MRELGLLVPSQRPHNIKRLWEAMKGTCRADTTLIVGVDDDDPGLILYPPGPAYVVLPDVHYVTAWCNVLAAHCAADYRAIGSIGDDNLPNTPGWDTEVLAALKRQPFAFADDENPSRPPGALSCHIFMRREIYDVLGYFGPPEISHMYVDVAWYAWGTACGIEFLRDVKIPHLHHTTGAPYDQTYLRSANRTMPDLAAWHAYSRRDGPGGLNDDIAKLGGQVFTADHLTRFNADLGIPGV